MCYIKKMLKIIPDERTAKRGQPRFCSDDIRAFRLVKAIFEKSFDVVAARAAKAYKFLQSDLFAAAIFDVLCRIKHELVRLSVRKRLIKIPC